MSEPTTLRTLAGMPAAPVAAPAPAPEAPARPVPASNTHCAMEAPPLSNCPGTSADATSSGHEAA